MAPCPKMRKNCCLLVLLLVTMVSSALAQVTPCPIFSDNMVLQRNTDKAPIWGLARAGKVVRITTSWDNQTYIAKADDSGRWLTSVTTPDAGGPYTITISDGSKKTTTIANVLIGEVWLCSGQSNMQMPVEGWGKVNNYAEEELLANEYSDIRFLSVQPATSLTPQDTLYIDGGSWQVCDSASVANFSATAYFFGRELYRQYRVPIGLINASWGGTIIEAWMSREAFEGIPDQEHNLHFLDTLPEGKEERKDLFMQQYAAWLDTTNSIIERDDVNISEYTSATFDDSGWDDYQLPQLASVDGTINSVWWVRTTVDIPSSWQGKEVVLNLGKIDDNDVTYFNGVSVGSTIGSVFNRSYTVPAALVHTGKAAIAIRIHDTGGLSGIDCGEKTFNIALADGSDSLCLTGAWKFKTAINSSSLPPMPVNTGSDPNVHTFLYNAMIHPLVPYTIKGAIWYQGENNVSQAYQYRDLLPMLINDWRQKWGYAFPFCLVQLANYMQPVSHPQESAWAELREAQQRTAQTMDNVAMAVTIDIGDADDIHPKNKQEVGRRLALAARNIAYGESDVAYQGPVYMGYRLEEGAVRVLFTPDTSTGLATADGEALAGFEIAGPDHLWHWAQATISDGSVIVSADDVPLPLAVRYAWGDNPPGNLTNATALPAAPFRSDDWPGVAFGNKR